MTATVKYGRNCRAALIWINNTKEDFGPVAECGASALRATTGKEAIQ